MGQFGSKKKKQTSNSGGGGNAHSNKKGGGGGKRKGNKGGPTATEPISEEPDFVFKLLLSGDPGVGKSSLLLRYSENTFNESIGDSIGVEFKTKMIGLEGKTIKIELWDTAGQERFRTITSAYYRGTDAIIFAYDITDQDTFANVAKWMHEAKRYAGEDTLFWLVGTKLDLEAKRAVSEEEARNWAEDESCSYIETSSKNDVNVTDLFTQLAFQILKIQNED
ncbi:Ras-related protein Rab-13 [Balamuthia mandrillaris]